MAKLFVFEPGQSLHKTLLLPYPYQQEAGTGIHRISGWGNDPAQPSLL